MYRTGETRDTTGDEDVAYHAHPVRAVVLGTPTAAHLDLIRARTLDDEILTEHEPYVWQVQASNDREDAYGTRMHRTTLDNFAAQATAGVAFMNSHRTGGFVGGAELPMGHTIEGRVVGASAANPLRLDVTAYTLRGLNLNGLSTDAFIDGMRSGIVRDVSVGFYGGEYRCSICERDMYRDWDCRHWPGRTYPKLDSKGNETGEVVRAVAWIHNANLAEVSAVYDGATPGCMVQKARRMAAAGQLATAEVDFLEAQYRVRLPVPARVHPVAVPPTTPEEARAVELSAEQIAAMRLSLVETGAAPDADMPEALRALVAEVRTLRPLQAEVASLRTIADEVAGLRAQAADGVQYRNDLVADALVEGARALGDKWDEPSYRTLLEAPGTSLATIKRLRDDWADTAARLLPAGRLTKEQAQRTNGHAAGEIPAAAFVSSR